MKLPIIGSIGKDDSDSGPKGRYAKLEYPRLAEDMCVGGKHLLQIVHYNEDGQRMGKQPYSQREVEKLRERGIPVKEDEDAGAPRACMEDNERISILNRFQSSMDV